VIYVGQMLMVQTLSYYVLDGFVWKLAVVYSLINYVRGHQGSHVAFYLAHSGEGYNVNPFVIKLLSFYVTPIFSPLWLLVYLYIEFGFQVVVAVFIVAFVLRLVWTKIGIVTGLIKVGWFISLSGIPVIPLLAVIFCLLVSFQVNTYSYPIELQKDRKIGHTQQI
jgi:hypothetical protein